MKMEGEETKYKTRENTGGVLFKDAGDTPHRKRTTGKEEKKRLIAWNNE